MKQAQDWLVDPTALPGSSGKDIGQLKLLWVIHAALCAVVSTGI